jgi:hypothetical protein
LLIKDMNDFILMEMRRYNGEQHLAVKLGRWFSFSGRVHEKR